MDRLTNIPESARSWANMCILRAVGSAAGSTFARIFFTMLRLTPPDRLKDASSSGQTLPERDAALPPRNVARFLFHQYIAQVHIWWPFLPLSLLRGTFQRIYKDTRGCGDFDKLLIFMVLALSSAECSDNAEYIAMTDINSPLNYFRTGLRFFTASSERARDLQSLQAIVLMTILMLKSGIPSLHGDLWHLSRYVMSAAIELGLHRHNAHWGFSPEELEVRNRTWWSIYCLERQIAVMTGRVLSVRDHAIHSPMPMDSSIDQLEPAEAAAAPLFQRHGHRVFSSMIGLRRIGGRVLESVYIARGPDHKALFTSFQQICSEVDSIRGSLERWKVDVEALEMKHSRVYYEFKVEYCLILLLLNRPSPTFMIPSHQMVAVCSRAASSVVRQWSKIRCEYGVSAIGTGFRTLHSVVMVGLAALYCDW